MEMFAMSVTGKTGKVTISPTDSNPKDALRALGFTDHDLQHLILSPTPFARPRSLDVTAVAPKHLALEEFPVPRPKTPDDVLPKNSDDKLISSNGFTPCVLLSMQKYYVSAASINLDPPFPQNCRMDYRLYWVNEYSETITGPVSYDKTLKTTRGQSVTDTEQLSAEFGVKVGDLSGKLSETITHSVTITNQTESDDTYHLSVPAAKIAVWTLWHLAEAFVIVDQNGYPLSYSGSTPRGLVNQSVTLPQNRFVNLRTDYRPDMVWFDNN
jgi:hypothetical protein